MAVDSRRAGDLHLAVTPTTFNRMQRVEDQIEQDLFERGDLPSVELRIGSQIGRDGDRALLGFGPRERQHALDNFAQPGRRAGDGRRARKAEELRDGAVQTINLAGDQVEVARVFATDPFVFAHHLSDRLDRAERVFYFVRDGRGHLTELRQAFAFAELAFEHHLLFEQLAVFDRGREVSREHEEHFALLGGQVVSVAAHDRQPHHAAFAPQRVSGDRFQSFEQRGVFDFGQLALFGDPANFRLFALSVDARGDRDLFQLQRVAQPPFGEFDEMAQLAVTGRRRADLRHQLAVEFDRAREQPPQVMFGRAAQRPGQQDHDQDQQRFDPLGVDSVAGVERKADPADAVDVNHHHQRGQNRVYEALADDQFHVPRAINEIGDDGRGRDRREFSDQIEVSARRPQMPRAENISDQEKRADDRQRCSEDLEETPFARGFPFARQPPVNRRASDEDDDEPENERLQ